MKRTNNNILQNSIDINQWCQNTAWTILHFTNYLLSRARAHFLLTLALYWDMVNWQDWEICELTQQGVSSRAYTPCLYSGTESLLAAFDLEVLKALDHDPEYLLSGLQE